MTSVSMSLLLLTLLAAASADRATILWNHSSSMQADSYWSVGAFAPSPSLPPFVYAGTFGVSLNSGTDVLSSIDGHVSRSLSGVFRECNDWGNTHQAFGAVGFDKNSQNMTVYYSPDPSIPPYSFEIGNGFYFAQGDSSCVIRDGAMLILGQYPSVSGDIGSSGPVIPNSACMMVVAAQSGAVTPGPCLTQVGDGETALTIGASQDGSVVVMVAGFQLLVIERTAPDWSSYRTRFSLNSSTIGGTFYSAVLSNDGSFLAHGMQGEAHVLKWSGSSYQLVLVIPTLLNMVVNNLAMSTAAGTPKIAVGYLDPGQIPRYGASMYDLSTGSTQPAWTFQTPYSCGQYTDTVSSIAISANGEVVSMTSWGDADLLNAQMHVFRGVGGNGQPLLALHTPGSMSATTAVAVDVHTVFVAAVGMQTHENLGIKGGFATLLRVDLQ